MFEKLKRIIIGNKVSQNMVDWQQSDRLYLLVQFICGELFFQFLWFSLVWMNDSVFGAWVNLQLLDSLWLICGNVFFFFIWVLLYLRLTKTNQEYKVLQTLILLVYTCYMLVMYLAIGLTNIFVGVTFVVATLLGFFFMWQRLAWWIFNLHLIGFLVLISLPFFGWDLPTLYGKPPIEQTNNSWSSKATLFWTLSNVFWSLPKALLSISVIAQWFGGMDNKLEKANHVINHDELTKVKNRRFIMQHIYNLLFNTDPSPFNSYNLTDKPQALSVIMLDVDHFKSINDTHGHLSGDMVLIELAKRLNEAMVGAGWEASRYGGEEFLLVLPQVTHADAMTVAGRIHQAVTIKEYQIIDGMLLKVTSSLGVASFSHNEVISMRKQHLKNRHEQAKSLIVSHPTASEISDTSPVVASQEDLIIESLISMADGALYDAKRLGRNRIVSANQYVDESNSRAFIEHNIEQTEQILAAVPSVQDIRYS
ncbi:MAG: hypothetical protein CR966_00750 [Pseudomonadales bacterium]|nr:MAG: hypothetical protein CR966_00750 [Pseudomonadales bacterium]